MREREDTLAGQLADPTFLDVDVFELTAVGMVFTDVSGRFRRVNPAFAELLGRSTAELTGTSFGALTSPDDVGRSQAVLRDLLGRAGGIARFEKRYLRPDGSVVWVDLTVRALAGADGQVAGFLAQGVDITVRRRVEAELLQATEESHRLALVARFAPSAIVIADPDGRIQWVNDVFTRMTGYRREEAVGHDRRDLLDGLDRSAPEAVAFDAQLARGEAAEGEFSLTTTDGRQFWNHIQVRPVVEGGVVAHLIGVERDVTKRREAEDGLRQARTRAEELADALTAEKELLDRVISAVPQLVFWKDARHRYLGCNTAYLAFHGLDSVDDLCGRDDAMLGVQSEIADLLEELERVVLASGQPVVDRQITWRRHDGQPMVLLLSVLPLGAGRGDHGVIVVAADVTQVQEMERQLGQGRRLESIGQLAAGIAHEINTPVQYLLSNTGFLAETTTTLIAAAGEMADLARDLGPGAADCAPGHQRLRDLVDGLDLAFLAEDVPNALRQSQEGLTRLTQIVRAMKDYAHPGTTREDTDINQAVENTTQVCRNEWKYVARLDLDLDPETGLVSCYAGEIKQVILNIVVNAAQALAEQRALDSSLGQGSIVVSTRREQDDVVIIIADDGPGMPEAVRQRIFEPFFTTKGVGKGTGQGLSLAQSIVVGKHHGQLDVASIPGRGTRFTIRLPLHGAPPPNDP